MGDYLTHNSYRMRRRDVRVKEREKIKIKNLAKKKKKDKIVLIVGEICQMNAQTPALVLPDTRPNH